VTLRLAPAHVGAAALCLGLAASNLERFQTPSIAAALGAAASVVALAVGVRLAAIAVLVAAVGWWWGSVRLDALDRSPLNDEIGRAGRAIVVITAQPRAGRFDIRVRGVMKRFSGADIGEPVQLELPLGRSPPVGAVIDALAVIKAPRGPSHGFDERTWLRRHGVHVVVRVDAWRVLGRRSGLGGFADRLRAALAGAIAPRVTGERRAVLEGIVLGDDTALSNGLRRDFRASGLYHILAVSGQNVVLVAAGALLTAWLLGISRLIGEVGALAAIAGYVVAVGAQPSVIRAGIAGALASLAWLSGRLSDAWQALLLGAVALLAWNPYVVYDAGFQLSFAAVVAIFTVAPRFSARLEYMPLPRTVRVGIAVSLACGVVTAPILWLQFGYLPLLGVVANVLVEPAMPLLLGLAFATAGVGLISPSSSAALAWANGWVAAYIARCAHVIGSLPFAQVSTSRGLAALLGVLLAAAYAWRRWQTS
jgi:competence protein ComEC